MKRVAVFGNTGGGKSTLSRQIAAASGLPLHILDKVQFQPGGIPVPPEEFQQAHQEILDSETWVIDGFGNLKMLWQRLDIADTLVYIDLPIYIHFWWVTKRFITGYFNPPEGWPENSPLWKSSMNSYKVLYLCEKHLAPKYREYVEKAKQTKEVHHLRSPKEIAKFIESIDN
ncbi:adenylate kinase [[Limnothrix rosea] IAM M-220]|uniref:adenylate kinase n=1 Tax=[Limnothrix rosea] IAM M-220 TaxID=454133 RepID=UPI000967F846|nr:adenylate kinase [[Limnothrix rosea] IAM M-220]OKH18896.1 adenylate kinase [[Limnothrix rosea] IAM M-220]